MAETQANQRIENGAQAIAALEAVLEFVERQDRELLDPAESNLVVNFAARIAAAESE